MLARASALLLATTSFGLVALALGQSAPPRSVLDGAFTEAQAIRGQAIYFDNCYTCHGDDMSGRDQAPPLAGPQFSDVWGGASLWSIVDRIGTMPPERPGVLSRDEAVDLLTYLLWFNGLPLGEGELSTDRSVLERMTFETPAPGQ